MKKTAILLAGLIMLMASSAWALPSQLTLTFQTGSGTPIVVHDNVIGEDFDARPDIIRYWGSVGDNWEVNVSTGRIGASVGLGIPQMAITSDVTYTPNGTSLGDLIITLSGITGVWSAPGAIATATGNTNVGGAATFTTKVAGEEVSTLSFAGVTLDFGGHDPFAASPDFDDVVELVASISQNGYGSNGFTYRLTPVPEASTMMFLGLGFLGLAIYTKRRSNA